jgi:hypothetical protein
MAARAVRTPMLSETLIQWREANGRVESTSTLTEAVRGDGSTAIETLTSHGRTASQPERELWLVPSRTYWNYDPNANVTTAQLIDDQRYAALRGPVESACPAQDGAVCSQSSHSYLGYPVWNSVRDFADAKANSIRIEQALAPSLQWRSLHYAKYQNHALVEERTVVALVAGEPAAVLFTPPSGPSVLNLSDYLDIALHPRSTAGSAMLSAQLMRALEPAGAVGSADAPQSGAQTPPPKAPGLSPAGEADREGEPRSGHKPSRKHWLREHRWRPGAGARVTGRNPGRRSPKDRD